MKHSRIVVFLLIATIFLSSIIWLPKAQITSAQDGTITGVDIVYVIDQSGSMGGIDYGSELHPIPNDPNGLRFSGLQQMVERLASYRMFYFHDSDVRFNIAVVYFGQTASVVVDPTTIDPDNSSEWETLGERLHKELSADEFKTNLGMTNHLVGLQEAKKQLQVMENDWTDGTSHQQVIFVLTDGEWRLTCPQPVDGENIAAPPYCSNGEFQSRIYAQMMDDYITTELPYPRYRLYAGGINTRSGEWWSYVRKWWEKWTHEKAELLNSNTMWTFFEEILAELTVNNSDLKPYQSSSGFFEDVSDLDRVPINPYLQEVVFIVHKAKPEQRVSIYQDDGTPVDSLATTKITDEDKYIERISIKNPQPGFMTIERPLDSEFMRTYMLQLNADVQCDPIGTAPQFIPQLVRCTISAKDGVELPPYGDPKYQLGVEARITTGGGGESRLPLSPIEPGVYSSYWLPSQPGQYGLTILGSTKTPAGEPFTFFGWPKDGTPVQVSVVETKARLETDASVTAMMPMATTVTLVDAQGTPVRMSPGIDDFVHIRLEASSDQEQQAFELRPGEAGYQGVVNLTYPTIYKLHLYGEVEDPLTKQVVSEFDQELAPISVTPPQISWEGFTSPWPQYRSAPVAFSLRDSDGDLWAEKIDNTWTLNAEVQVQSAEGDIAVPVNVSGPGQWEGAFSPQEAGDSQIIISIRAEDTQGNQVVLLEKETVLPVTVEPMTLVRMSVASPKEDEQVPWRDIFWRATPILITAAVTDENGVPLDPALVQERAGDKPFEIEVISPNGEGTEALPMRRSDEAGKYEVIYEGYPSFSWYSHQDLGWHEIRLHPVAKLKNTYVMETDDDQVSRIELTRHPLWWVLPLVIGVFLLLMVVIMARNAYLRAWVAQGEIVTSEGRRVLRLSNSGKNTVVINSGLPTGVKKVKIHHPLGKKRVKMTVWTIRKGKTVKSGPSLTSAKSGIRHEMGNSSPPRFGFSALLLLFSLLSLLFLAGFGGVLYAIFTSLS